MTLPALLEHDQQAHRPQLVVLPPLRLEQPPVEELDDDARFWLTAAGAITVAGLEHVDLIPGLDEIVRWDHPTERWVRL